MSDDADRTPDDRPQDSDPDSRSKSGQAEAGPPAPQAANANERAAAESAATRDVPPGVLVAPRLGVKRFNRLPAGLAGSTLVLVVCGVVYVFTLTQDAVKQKTQREQEEGHTADIQAIFSKAPNGSTIPAATGPIVAQGDVGQTALAPLPLRSRPEPGMTHAEIEGRRQMWTSYYQALNSAQQRHLDASYDALSADTESGTSARPGNRPGAAQNTAGDPEQQPGGTGDGARDGRGTSLVGGRPNGNTTQGGFFDQIGATPATDYLQATVTEPVSSYEVKSVDIIEARMISGLTSDSHGVVRAVVSKNVYDHATGLHILIPQGSQLKGLYNTGVSYGQKRVEVAWQRVIYPAPCDQSLDLGQMPGSDQSGYSGFHDITDNHYGQIFLNAMLLSAFAAASQLSQGNNYSAYGGYNSSQVAAGAVGQQLSTLGEEFARRGLDIPPTEKVRNGYPFTIMVTKDIAFAQPWTAGQCAGQEVTVAQR